MMKKYEIGLYEKAMRNTLSWSEKLGCAKECGYDYMEMCIDATTLQLFHKKISYRTF